MSVKKFKFIAGLFREIMASLCPSRAAMNNSGAMEGLSIETVGRDGTCQILEVKIQSPLCRVLIKHINITQVLNEVTRF